MRRETIGKVILITIFLITFWFSSKPATESSGQSGRALVNLRIISNEDMTLKTERYNKLSHIIRKTAHFSLYFIAGIGAFLATGGNIGKSIFIVFALAGIDEFHQHFVPGRGAQFKDVLLDTSGGTTAITILKLMEYSFRIERFRYRKRFGFSKL